MKHLAASLVFVVLMSACNSQPTEPRSLVFRIDGKVDGADDCGGSLPFNTSQIRRCAKLGEKQVLSGIFLRTFEGTSFAIGMMPKVPFAHNRDNTVDLVIDDETRGTARLPNFREPSSRYPYDPVLMQIEGRLSLTHSANPNVVAAQRLFVVDRIDFARRLEVSDIGPRSRGS